MSRNIPQQVFKSFLLIRTPVTQTICLYFVLAKCVMCSAEKKKFGITDNGPIASTSVSAAAAASSSSRYHCRSNLNLVISLCAIHEIMPTK